MADTVFVRGTGGTIFEMDVPESGHARERFDQALAKGELVVIEHAVWVERPDGSRHLEVPAEPDDNDTDEVAAADEPRPKRGRKAAAADADEAPAADDAEA